MHATEQINTKGGSTIRSKIARMLVVLLLVGLIPSVGVPQEARAEEVRLPPIADKFVDNLGGYPTGTGINKFLSVGYFDESMDGGDNYGPSKSALKFDLGEDRRQVESAVLRIYVSTVSSYTKPPILDLYTISNDWEEDTTSTLPTPKGQPIVHIAEINQDEWLNIDVTDAIKAKKAGGERHVSFLLQGYQTLDLAPGNEYILSEFTFYDRAKENATFATSLDITYLPNQPPTNLTLSSNTIPENSPVGTVIGTLSATDPDASDILTYSLVGGDLSSFRIQGDQLLSNAVFDYETKNAYSIKVRVTDSADNTLEEEFSITVTNVNEAPQITSFQLVGGNTYVNNEDVSLSLSITDPDAGDSLRYQLSNTPNIWDGNWQSYTTTPTTANWTLSVPEQDGSKTVYVLAEDEGGLQAEAELTITLDKTQPTGSLTINQGALYTSSAQVTLLATGSDANGISGMRFSNDPNVWESFRPYSTESVTWNVPAGDGEKEVWMQLRDTAGNISDPIRATITLDTTPPVVSGVVAGWVYSTDVEITFNEGTATLNGIPFTSGSRVTAEGEHTLVVTDNAGNTTTLSFFILKNAPTGSVSINGGAAYTNSQNVTLAINIDGYTYGLQMAVTETGGTPTYEAYAPTKNWTLSAGDGLKTIEVHVKDRAGNEGILTAAITLDTVKPTGSITINDGASATNSTQVTLRVQAADANPVEVRFSNDGTDWTAWASLPQDGTLSWELTDSDGSKTVIMEVRDQAGNTERFAGSITLDTIPPVVSGVTNGAFYNQDVTITFDEGTATLNGVPFTSGTTVSAEGEHTLIVTDEVGNATTVSFSIVKTLPQGSLQINGGAAYTNSQNVTLAITVNGSADGLQMAVTEAGGTPTYEPYTATKNWTLSAGDGLKTIQVHVKDRAGNERILTAAITLDTVKPTGSITINDGASVTLSTQVTLRIRAADVNPVEVRFSNDGTDWTDWASPPQDGRLSWVLTGADGSKTVMMEVRDEAGNTERFAGSITLDTTPPVVTGVTDGAFYNQDVSIAFNEGTATLNGVPFTSGTTVSAEDRYVLIVTDRAGNTTTIQFAIDRTAPTGGVTINNGASTTTSRNVTLTINATDNLGNIEMRVSNEYGAWSNWQPWTNRLPWIVEGGNGQKKVLLELRDEAGNVSEWEDTIELILPTPQPPNPNPNPDPEPEPEPPTEIPVTDVQLDVRKVTLRTGEIRTLTATIHPHDATDKTVSWASSDSRVAEVDDTGKVTAKQAGTATITVTTRDGGKTDSAEVTVRDREAASFYLEASESAYWLQTGQRSLFYIYKVEGKRRTNITKDKGITYSTEHDLVTLGSGRIVAGKEPGEDIITVRYEGEELTIPVTVSNYLLRKLTLSNRYAVLEEGEERQLKLTGTFSNREEQDVSALATWDSSDTDVVEVTDDGRLIAHEAGTAVITARLSGKIVIANVRVMEEKEPQRIVASPAFLRLEVGDTKEIVLYADYGNRYLDLVEEEVEWDVQNPEIVAVEDGEAIALQKGRTVITVRYQGKEDTIPVTVR